MATTRELSDGTTQVTVYHGGADIGRCVEITQSGGQIRLSMSLANELFDVVRSMTAVAEPIEMSGPLKPGEPVDPFENPFF